MKGASAYRGMLMMAKRAKATAARGTPKGRSGGGKSIGATKRAETLRAAAAEDVKPPASFAAASDLPLEQVQAMLRLVGETAELWYDPKLQRKYMLESLCRLL